MTVRDARRDRGHSVSPPPLAGEGQGGGTPNAEQSKRPNWQVTRTTRSRARSLRRDSTNAERIIWEALRAHRMKGASFRRQTPIGPYIADFVCHSASLIIEIDGGQHFSAEGAAKDARRTAFPRTTGYRVLRFNNHDVLRNRAGALETIASALDQSPSLALPRKRGRESAQASGEGKR